MNWSTPQAASSPGSPVLVTVYIHTNKTNTIFMFKHRRGLPGQHQSYAVLVRKHLFCNSTPFKYGESPQGVTNVAVFHFDMPLGPPVLDSRYMLHIAMPVS